MLLYFEYYKHRLATDVPPSDAEYKGAVRDKQEPLLSREHDYVFHVPIPLQYRFRGLMHHLHFPESNSDPHFYDINPL